MSSVYVKYDPTLFRVEKLGQVSTRLNEFVVGRSKLGAPVDGETWETIPIAAFTINAGYTPDENGTLIIDPASATLALSHWDTAGVVIEVADRVRASYNNVVQFNGIVESTTVRYEADPDARRHGATRRVDVSASIADYNAIMMSKIVSWDLLPEELAIDRISRWVDVLNWSGDDPDSPEVIDPPPGALRHFSTSPALAIPDVNEDGTTTEVTTDIVVTGQTGNASNASVVTLDITHTYASDLTVQLIGPSGAAYMVWDQVGFGGTTGISDTFVLNLSAETANGTWTLRVGDHSPGDVGTINSWAIDI